MTDASPPKAIKTFENAGIWLPGLAVDALRHGHLVLDGYTFKDCAIDGPGVIAAVNAVGFRNCDFGRISAVADLLFSPKGQHLTGAIGFSNTTFENCRFDMVGFTGNEEFLADFERSLRVQPAQDGAA